MDPTLVTREKVEFRGGTLEVVGATPPRSLIIDSEARVVGRSVACDLPLDDRRVSAAHVELLGTDRGVRLRDLGSSNGTFVGEMRVEKAYLSAAAELRCGDTTLRFTPLNVETRRLPPLERFGALVGTTPSMRALFARLEKVAPTTLTVLITGETGTGKEVVAKAIHAASPRADKPFIAVNCVAIAESLIESELFGHERGAFTGADRARPGLFVEADGGTLFLDELGEMNIGLQAKLLRVLEEREVRPVGGARARKVDVRVIAATRRDLAREVNAERFRSDLFFRVAQLRVELPPLRQRIDDLPALVERILEDQGAAATFRRVTNASLARLSRHDWPGNVRELKNVVSVALALNPSGPLDLAEHLTLDISTAAAAGAPDKPFAQVRAEMEKAYFTALHAATGGNLSEIARRADVDRKTAREQLRRHGIGNASDA